ncbi:MAG: Fe-S cluster assembly sulfur transfer protein SufU [Erysipelotrichaceae bacterium]
MNELLNNPMLLRQIIMDHYDYPRNHALTEDESYQEVHMASESCIDDIKVQAKIEAGVIQDIRFDGIACTISTASTSIMSELLKGKTIEEAQKIIAMYQAMIEGAPFDIEVLEEAVAFHNVGKQANRIKCATIGWNAMERILKEKE